MKTTHKFFLLAAGFALAISAGCDLDNGNNKDKPQWNGPTIIVSVNNTTGPKYYSLITGERVTGEDIKSTAWDIGFQRTRLILTNSGDTAIELGSQGNGYVWYTEKFDMDAATIADRVTDDPHGNAWGTDKKIWVYGMPTSENKLNVMSYVGYESLVNGTGGDGSVQAKPLRTFLYNQKQFCTMTSMSSSAYGATGRVYIIRHADGIHHSKIRIREYESEGGTRTDTFVVEYEALD